VRRTGDPRHLHLKLVLFFTAAGLFLAALVTGWDGLALAAIGVLALTLALRFLPRESDSEPDHGNREGEPGRDDAR
jgi:hypothetical protein